MSIIVNILIVGTIILIIMININIEGLIISRYKTLSGISFWKVIARNSRIQFIDLTMTIIHKWNGGMPSLIIRAKVSNILVNSLFITGLEINENMNMNDAKI